MNDNLIHEISGSPLSKSAGFFSFKKYWIKKHFIKGAQKERQIEPNVYWRFIDEVSAFTKK